MTKDVEAIRKALDLLIYFNDAGNLDEDEQQTLDQAYDAFERLNWKPAPIKESDYAESGFTEFNKLIGNCPHCGQYCSGKTTPKQMMQHYRQECIEVTD